MLGKLTQIANFTVCKEKKRLYQFIKKCYEHKVKDMQVAMLHANDLEFTVQVLENIKYIKSVQEDEMAKIGKAIIMTHDLTKLTSATLAVQIMNALKPYLDSNDRQVMEEIYKFYRTHPYLFDKHQIHRLQYYFYSLGEKTDFEDPVQMDDDAESVSNTRMFTPIAQQLYNFQPHPSWNLWVRHDPDTQTSTASLHDKKSGKVIRMVGTFPNSYEDLAALKSQVQEYKCVLINLPPLPEQQSQEPFSMLNKISDSITDKVVFKQKYRTMVIEDLKNYVSRFKNLEYMESKQVVTGVQQGFIVPYTMESLMYHLSKLENPPQVVLTGLDNEERLKLYLNDIPSNKIVEELQTLRMQWLNHCMSWITNVQRIGCFTCGSQAEGLMLPSQIMNEHKDITKWRASIGADLVIQWVHQSLEKNFLYVVDEQLFYQMLKQLCTQPLEGAKYEIDSYRKDLLSRKYVNTSHLSAFGQFYEDTLNTDKIYRVCSQEILDLNRMSKQKYENGIQIRCGARSILF